MSTSSSTSYAAIVATTFIYLITQGDRIGVSGGPVDVRVLQDDTKSFHVGSEPRSTFELVEEYKPLSTAYNQKNQPPARAHASSLVKGPKPRFPSPVETSPAQVLVDLNQSHEQSSVVKPGRDATHQWQQWRGDATPTAPKRSHWLEWTRWSECTNGERIRIRQCLEVSNVKCQGPNIERQKCFSFQPSNIPFASDPHVIEKEIAGVESR